MRLREFILLFAGWLGGTSYAVRAEPAPRLLAPLSATRLTSMKPSLRWELAAAGAVQVELCRDRGCQQLLQTLEGKGGTVTPSQPLPAGVVYWRVRAADKVSATWQLQLGHHNAPVGTTLDVVLDVNGDGCADVLLGSQLYLGSSEGLSPKPAATFSDPALQIRGLNAAGDVNGDGYTDVIAAAPKARKLYVFYGGQKGLQAQPDATIAAPEKTSTFGSSLTAVGDVNGDGYADVVVGAPGLLTAYLYLGGASGLSAQPAVTLKKPSRHEPSSFGALAIGPGDVNGDGLADFVVLSPGNNYIYGFHGAAQGPSQSPALSLFGGGDTQASSALSAAGDVNGDGYADVLYTAVTYPSEYPRLLLGGPKGLHPSELKLKLPGRPEGSSAEEGETSLFLRGAGDVNGDGFDDAFVEFSDENDMRSLHLYEGSAAGLKSQPTIMQLKSRGVRVEPGGDVNGDGYDDLMVLQYKDEASSPQALLVGVQLYPGGPKGLAKKPVQSLSLNRKK